MGGSDKASKAAQAGEDQRRQQVTDTQRRIEDIYSAPGRENDIRDVEGATRDYLQGDLNRQNTTAGRELKFALARSGQTMGSTDANQNRKLAEAFLRGSVEVQRRAGAAGNSLRQADQSAKLGLFSQALAGLDMTTATRQAGESMRNNIGMARADAMQTGLGDVFGDLGNIYKRSREKSGEEQAERYRYNTFFTPNSYYSGGTGGREFG